MNVTISAPHCTVSDRIRGRAEERLTRLRRYEPRLRAADVRFDLDHGLHRVEARLTVAGGPTTIAHGTGETFRAALEVATDRLRRQLQRRRKRRHEHQAVKLSEQLSPAGGS